MANTPDLALTASTYIKKYMFKIHGFVEIVDAKIISELVGFQNTKGFHGSLVEIGVHHGRLFFIMAFARAEGEKLLAIDIFEDDDLNVNTKGSGRNVKFFENCQKLGLTLADNEIYKGSSLDIDAKFVVLRVGRSKFFSVDGGHMFHHVANDLQIAQRSLTPEGIIAIDDFCNSTWPEVTFAIYDFLKENGEIVPFLISRGKLYCTTKQYSAIYRDRIASCSSFDDWVKAKITIFGSETLVLKQRTDRIKDHIKGRLKLILYRAHFRQSPD